MSKKHTEVLFFNKFALQKNNQESNYSREV